MNIKEQILEVLKNSEEPLKIGDISKQLKDIDKKEISEILKELKKDEVIHSPKRCCYSLA